MSVTIKKTTKKEQNIANIAVLPLASFNITNNVVTLTIQNSPEVIAIPLSAFILLQSIIENMAQGKSIAVLPTDTEITIKEAAKILNVSQSHIMQLLKQGKIPFKKISSHQRILLNDLLEYEKTFKTERRKYLDFLAQEAQELNLGYE